MAKKNVKKDNKGLNKEVVNKLFRGLPSAEEVFELDDAIKTIENNIENGDDDMKKVEEVVEVVNAEEVKEVETVEIPAYDDIDTSVEIPAETVQKVIDLTPIHEEALRINAKRDYINSGIRYAIKAGREGQGKSVTARQIQSIFTSYKRLVGIDMTDVQKTCIKKLNEQQVKNIIWTLNKASRDSKVA